MADRGYTRAVARRLDETRGWRLEVVRHPERQLWRYGLEERPKHTFRVLPPPHPRAAAAAVDGLP